MFGNNKINNQKSFAKKKYQAKTAKSKKLERPKNNNFLSYFRNISGRLDFLISKVK